MDYASAPIQPIVQGVVTFSGTTPSFFGRGVKTVTRLSAGVYNLLLDQGLPGNSAGIEPTPPGVSLPSAPTARGMITLRGSTTTVTQANIGYGQTSPAPSDGSLNLVQVTLVAGTPIDNAFEVIVWQGLGNSSGLG